MITPNRLLEHFGTSFPPRITVTKSLNSLLCTTYTVQYCIDTIYESEASLRCGGHVLYASDASETQPKPEVLKSQTKTTIKLL